MLLIFLNWIFITVISFIFGYAFVQVFKFFIEEEDKSPVNFSILVILGLIALTAITSVITLFSKIGLVINILVIVIAIQYAIINYRGIAKYLSFYYIEVKKANPWLKLLFFFSFLLALIYSASPSQNHDDGMYYMQTIKWIENYAVVPGLGNIHGKLAFNSNWHVLSSLFGFSYLGIPALNDLNGLLHIMVVTYAFTGLQSLMNGKYELATILKVLMFIPTFIFLKYFTAPTPDLAAIYLIWIAIIFLVKKIEEQSLEVFNIRSLMIIIFCTYICTIKLSALPICIPALYIFFKEVKKKNYMHMAVIIIAVLDLLAPWLIRNIIQTGYVLYPFEHLDLFNFDWEIPKAVVIWEADWIESWARIPSVDADIVNKMSISEWFPVWFDNKRIYDKAILFFIVISSLVFSVRWLVRIIKGKFSFDRMNEGWVVIYLTLIAGIAMWFWKAPDFRFGYGFTLFFCFLVVAQLAKKYFFTFRPQTGIKILYGTTVLFYLIPLFLTFAYYKVVDKNYLVYPAPVVKPVIEKQIIDGKTFLITQSVKQCWDEPLPCIPPVNVEFELRTGSIQDGFRVATPHN